MDYFCARIKKGGRTGISEVLKHINKNSSKNNQLSHARIITIQCLDSSDLIEVRTVSNVSKNYSHTVSGTDPRSDFQVFTSKGFSITS